MNIITLDFESYYDSDFTLKKCTTEQYVRDPRFEVLGLGVRWPDGHLDWLTERKHILALGATNFAVLCHHAHFDCLILSHVFGIKPRFILDTLPMARLVLGSHAKLSLEALAERFGLAPKSVPYNLFKGKHWQELTPAEQELVAQGCLHDCELTWRIFCELAKEFPESEYPVVDATVRMFSEPSLEGDQEILGKVWTDEQGRKQTLLRELDVAESDLQSNESFAALLRAEGCEPDTKESPSNPEQRIYAFAKTDDFLRNLAEEESSAGDLARARLGIKSTIVQTRAERLGDMSSRGPLCIYLAPYAAHTLRWGGGDKTNFQNFPRQGDIRKSIRAPKGYLLAKADASQIEARLLDTLAGQWDYVEKWRSGIDLYSEFASLLYNQPVSKAQPELRGTGKQATLSCGYGSGAATIMATAKKGSYGPPVILTEEQALQIRDLYRNTRPAICGKNGYWATASRLLARLAGGAPTEWGPMEIRNKRIYLPNGTWLNFDSLEYDQEEQSWRYATRKGWQRIWGSSLVAETTQALARVLTAGVIAECRRVGLRVVWTTHDDIVLLVEDNQWAVPTLQWLKEQMVKVPSWLPELPLAVEGELKEAYG